MAPVRADRAPLPPTPVRYHGAHGRPLAFGGGVCPLSGAHSHVYPPAPRAAFARRPRPDGQGDGEDGEPFVETRRLVPFEGPHALPGRGRSCREPGWHLHVCDEVEACSDSAAGPAAATPAP